jgi:uncharacterized membrane protein
MKSETFKLLKAAFAAVLAAGIAISVIGGIWYVPGVLILLTAAFFLLIKRRVTDITEDERDRKVGGKAALMAMTIYSISAAIIGTSLVAYSAENTTLYGIGSAILYSACAFMVLYALLFQFYVRRQDQD